MSTYDEPRARAKLILRSLALTSTVIGIVVAGIGWPLAWPLFIPLAISFGWNIANIVRRYTSSTPIHPGANVGMDLVAWLGFLACSIVVYLLAVAGFAAVYITTESDSYNYYYGYYTASYDTVYDSQMKTWAICAVIAAIIGTKLLIEEFILFVFACIDTHNRNKRGVAPGYPTGGYGYGGNAEPVKSEGSYGTAAYPQQNAPQHSGAYDVTGQPVHA